MDPVNNYARPLLSAAPQCGVNGFALSGVESLHLLTTLRHGCRC